ncbi:phosphotransferase family protein [Vibrio parahaemolyticus]|uniref:WfeP n=1 Tax=Vibrio parahaemolyticus TaxID=670 RepID=A0A5P5X5G5_VIBPH|nr:phosphotransferase [Vibrio parahaemolyticus]QFF90460.1 WfeP [Vibrio parahaemolyticus]
MKDISNKIQRASHSGAILNVVHRDNGYFVSKVIRESIDRNYDAILKQKRFNSLKTNTYEVKSIPVESINKSEQELEIIMPFIDGVGGEQVVHKGSKVVAKSLKSALDFYLINSLSNSSDAIYQVDKIISKIDDVELKIKEKKQEFPELIEHIKAFREYCSKDLKLPIGECHGDLTLSNLKITETNELMLFDFLSCDINSPLQDAAKLIQDLEYGWSFRKEKESVRTKGEIFCTYAMPNLINLLNRLFQYEMRVIEILTILRIAPYIKRNDTKTISWFNETMSKSMSKIIG